MGMPRVDATTSDFFTASGVNDWNATFTPAKEGGFYLVNGQVGEIWYIPPSGDSYHVVASLPALIGPPDVIASPAPGEVYFLAHCCNYPIWHVKNGEEPQVYAWYAFGDPHILVVGEDGHLLCVSHSGSIDRIPLVTQTFIPHILWKE
jgi:hypothetical protein